MPSTAPHSHHPWHELLSADRRLLREDHLSRKSPSSTACCAALLPGNLIRRHRGSLSCSMYCIWSAAAIKTAIKASRHGTHRGRLWRPKWENLSSAKPPTSVATAASIATKAPDHSRWVRPLAGCPASTAAVRDLRSRFKEDGENHPYPRLIRTLENDLGVRGVRHFKRQRVPLHLGTPCSLARAALCQLCVLTRQAHTDNLSFTHTHRSQARTNDCP